MTKRCWHRTHNLIFVTCVRTIQSCWCISLRVSVPKESSLPPGVLSAGHVDQTRQTRSFMCPLKDDGLYVRWHASAAVDAVVFSRSDSVRCRGSRFVTTVPSSHSRESSALSREFGTALLGPDASYNIIIMAICIVLVSAM